MCIHWRIITLSPEGEREAVVTDVAQRGTSLKTQNAKLDQLRAQNVGRLVTWRNAVGPRLRIIPREDDFAFSVQSDIRDIPTTNIQLGEFQLEGVLVDSGSTCNVIDRETWETLKRKKHQMQIMEVKPEVVLLWL